MKHVLWIFAGCWLALSPAAQAQNRTVTGTVAAADDGQPIAGANVSVKGTNTGTTTDGSGSYRLAVPDGATLIFSFVGTLTQEIAVGNQTVIHVRLQVDTRQLEEVVVTALGIQKAAKGLGFSQNSLKTKNSRWPGPPTWSTR